MSSNKEAAVTIILERDDGGFGGRIEDSDFLLTTEGQSVEEVVNELRDLITDFIEHEGKSSTRWASVNPSEIQFEYAYDLSAFFSQFKELKVTEIAARAGINKNLLQQYVSGNKNASEQQAKKIESAVHALADQLKQVVLV